ncbi:hypothetical protein [Vibrio sp. D431a]|nr:hypothetical protein [Vibrio sp. D431a]MDK9790055.1 hypothetical protein [Vibrio sp. D431a]
MTVLDLLTLVLDRGGGLGTVLFVVLLLRVRVTVTWTRAQGLRLGLRL